MQLQMLCNSIYNLQHWSLMVLKRDVSIYCYRDIILQNECKLAAVYDS